MTYKESRFVHFSPRERLVLTAIQELKGDGITYDDLCSTIEKLEGGSHIPQNAIIVSVGRINQKVSYPIIERVRLPHPGRQGRPRVMVRDALSALQFANKTKP